MGGGAGVEWADAERLAALAVRAGAGDRGAMDELFREFAPAVYAVALAHVRHEDAQDVVQEVFVSAMREVGGVRDGGRVGAWLMTIARREAIDCARGRNRGVRRLVRYAMGFPPGQSRARARAEPGFRPKAPACDRTRASVGAGGDERERAWSVEEVLASLREVPEAYREALALRLIAGLSGPRIALVMGMTHASVRVNLHRGMEKLREKLGSTR